MCGRYASYRNDRMRPLEQALAVELPIAHAVARYNIAPNQPVEIVRADGHGRYEAAQVIWGLVPAWSKVPMVKYSTINARAETVATSPAFRNAYRHHRCLIPADGYYEWQAVAGEKAKRPYFIHRSDDTSFAFAGLWEHWERDGGVLESCSILTTDANARLRDIHARMPVVIEPQDYRRWIDGGPDDVQGLLHPAPEASMQAYRVSQHVNSPRHDDAGCIEPLREADE
jgi:putative SOS response-associated peptidase YedK